MLCPIPPTVTLEGRVTCRAWNSVLLQCFSLCSWYHSKPIPVSATIWWYVCMYTLVLHVATPVCIVWEGPLLASNLIPIIWAGHVHTLFIKHYWYSTTVCFLCVCVCTYVYMLVNTLSFEVLHYFQYVELHITKYHANIHICRSTSPLLSTRTTPTAPEAGNYWFTGCNVISIEFGIDRPSVAYYRMFTVMGCPICGSL